MEDDDSGSQGEGEAEREGEDKGVRLGSESDVVSVHGRLAGILSVVVVSYAKILAIGDRVLADKIDDFVFNELVPLEMRSVKRCCESSSRLSVDPTFSRVLGDTPSQQTPTNWDEAALAFWKCQGQVGGSTSYDTSVLRGNAF